LKQEPGGLQLLDSLIRLLREFKCSAWRRPYRRE
jgi:hypothetical protein